MSLNLITPPAKEPLTLLEVKNNLRLDHDDHNEDTLIEDLITAARQHAENVLAWRAFITQTWELWLDAWPGKDYIELPRPPLQSVTSVNYYDVDDTETTFAAGSYFVDTKSEDGRVGLNHGQSWPGTTLRPFNGICVTFVAGYGADGSFVPAKFRKGLLLLVGHWYEHREEVVIGVTPSTVPMAAEALICSEKAY